MTEGSATRRELALSRLGSGRLSAPALQMTLERTEMSGTMMPAGGLTRAQVAEVRLDRLAAPLWRLGRWLFARGRPGRA